MRDKFCYTLGVQFFHSLLETTHNKFVAGFYDSAGYYHIPNRVQKCDDFIGFTFSATALFEILLVHYVILGSVWKSDIFRKCTISLIIGDMDIATIIVLS